MKLLKTPIAMIFLFSCAPAINDSDVLAQLEKKYDAVFIDEFKTTPSNELFEVYMDTLCSDIVDFLEKDSLSKALFKKYDIIRKSEQAKVVLYWWHQKLNSKSFAFENHLKSVQNQNKEREEKEREKEEISKNNYDKFVIGDTLTLEYPVYVGNNGYKNAFMYDDPARSWEFDENKDLRIQGILLDKKKIDFGEYTFELKITDINRDDTYFMMRYYKRNDAMIVSLAISPQSIFRFTSPSK